MSSRRSALLVAPLLAAVALVAPARAGVEGVVLTTTLSPAYVPPGAPVTLSVSAPALAGATLDFEQRSPTGWTRVGHAVVSSSGSASVTLVRWRAGAYDFRVADNALGASAPDGTLAGDVRRLVVTVAGFGDPRAYRVAASYRGLPVRWDPCRTITYRTNLAEAPASAKADLAEAIRRLAQATGLRFRSLGSTRQVYGAKGFRYDADVDVAWTTPSESPVLGGSTAGYGGTTDGSVSRGRERYTHGFVVVDRDKMASLPAGFGAGATQGLVLLHELGHLAGLAHVTAADQLMQASPQSDSRAALYGAGDLSGLARLGSSAGCV
jgi:hypothetical protein